MKIEITYCVQWNYLPKASSLAARIEMAVGVAPVLIEGRGGIFEVAVDGRRIFSKKSAGRFSDPEEIVTLLRP